jgi:hypothetical protein
MQQHTNAPRKSARTLDECDLAAVARAAMGAFKAETGLTLVSTPGGQLRVLGGGNFRKLTYREYAQLWTTMRGHLEQRGCRLSCKIIRTGLKAISAVNEKPMRGVAR